MKMKYLFLALSFCTLLIFGCSEDEDSKTLVESFDVELDNAHSIPMVIGRTETGTVKMDLYDDNSLEFTITISNLAMTDELTMAHVHTGDVVSTGDVAIGLVDGSDIAFSDGMASGTVMLDGSQISTLQGSDVYVNVHSKESASGLIRGQIDQTIDNAYNVALSPANEVPAVMGRSESGSAYFRIVGSMLYYKVIVNDLDAADAITAGHIHEGGSMVNGGVFKMLDIAGLDMTKNLMLSADELTKVNTDELYVNIHSTQQATGLLRGQIR